MKKPPLTRYSDRFIADNMINGQWDAVRNPADCLHCHGTSRAPSTDGRTPCGFCDPSVPPRNATAAPSNTPNR